MDVYRSIYILISKSSIAVYRTSLLFIDAISSLTDTERERKRIFLPGNNNQIIYLLFSSQSASWLTSNTLIVIPHQCCQCATFPMQIPTIQCWTKEKDSLSEYRRKKPRWKNKPSAYVFRSMYRASAHARRHSMTSSSSFFSPLLIEPVCYERGRAKKCVFLFIPRVDSNRISSIHSSFSLSPIEIS